MQRFPSAAALASWAGLAPGNNASAGRQHSGRTRKGNTWLRSVLVQAAQAAAHMKHTSLASRYRRIAARGETRHSRLGPHDFGHCVSRHRSP